VRIKTQIISIAGAILILSLINSGLTLLHAGRIDDHSRIANVSGKVRGEGQRAVTILLAGGTATESISETEEMLEALIYGSEDLGIAPPTNPEMVEKARSVQIAWRNLKQTMKRGLGDDANVVELLRQSEAFYAEANLFADFALAMDAGSIGLKTIEMMLSFCGGLLIVALIYISRKINRTLADTSHALVGSANEIATTVEEQEQVAVNQASSINETVTTMEELQASLKQTTDQSEKAAEIARDALHHTEEGNRAVETTLEGMSGLKTQVENVADGILKLSEQISQIGEITNSVGDLASRTNMLALNASVEAARAGSTHGKGFAVVAGEIRRLADESRKSTERIETLVREIQTATNATVMITEEGTKTVDRMSHIASNATVAFEELASSMNETNRSTQQTLLSIRQQLAAVGQVSEAMSELNAGAEQSSRGMTMARDGIVNLKDTAARLSELV
jgi:methyl-accepting chemotaxis protein